MKILSKCLATLGIASIFGLSSVASAATDLTMYYPVAVGGSLTKVVDGMVEQFEAENPDINVNAIYAGNYNDARKSTGCPSKRITRTVVGYVFD